MIFNNGFPQPQDNQGASALSSMNAHMFIEGDRRVRQATSANMRPKTKSMKFYDKDGKEAGVIVADRVYYATGYLPKRQGPPMPSDMPPIAAPFNHVTKMSSL